MWQNTLKSTLTNHKFQVAAASTLSFAAGVSIGYLALKKRMREHFENVATEEILLARKYYIRASDKPDLEEVAARYEDTDIPEKDMQEFQEAVEDIIQDNGYVSYNKVFESPSEQEEAEVNVSVRKNIFDGSTITFNQEDEDDKKRIGLPYIVPESDYMLNTDEHIQTTLEYYEIDDVLIDDGGSIVDDRVALIGSDNMIFGCGTDDKNAVYICNDQMQTMFEVVRSNLSYSKNVLGFDDSLEHSNGPKIRKFRDYD